MGPSQASWFFKSPLVTLIHTQVRKLLSKPEAGTWFFPWPDVWPQVISSIISLPPFLICVLGFGEEEVAVEDLAHNLTPFLATQHVWRVNFIVCFSILILSSRSRQFTEKADRDWEITQLHGFSGSLSTWPWRASFLPLEVPGKICDCSGSHVSCKSRHTPCCKPGENGGLSYHSP